ncbi:EI24 domain-containing protein [Undibacterium flavidum]|uniref:EI24 domain-containing protein n=1 Tax=Undibacterium flavidum TaxID=2762297 RepID=A0ABR6YE39_9BURK|nr:EI24 domain-containing protein [Undibacterium flavidum]MBC3874829.1 EI24 domain-containing protein [Undibacterium flavidum]
MNFTAVLRSWARALSTQFRFKILLLSVIPLLISLAVWGGLMAWRLQAVFDFIQSYFSNHDGFTNASAILNSLGLLALKTVIVPLLAMWLLLPLVIITSLLFIGVLVMPTIAKHVGQRDFPQLELRRGSSFLASLGFSLGSFFLFVFAWVVTLPLFFVPPIYVLVQPLLWGWLTYRVMSYDALAPFADKQERQLLVARHRGSLLLIGLIAGWFSGLPSMLWMGGAMSMAYVAFFPIFVSLAIWAYLLIFIFTGLWYQHFCLDALQVLRQERHAEVI